MSHSQDVPRFVRAKDAAAFLGLGTSTVWRWAREGRIPKPIKLSARASVWKLDDLKAFVAAQDAAQKGGRA